MGKQQKKRTLNEKLCAMKRGAKTSRSIGKGVFAANVEKYLKNNPANRHRYRQLKCSGKTPTYKRSYTSGKGREACKLKSGVAGTRRKGRSSKTNKKYKCYSKLTL